MKVYLLIVAALSAIAFTVAPTASAAPKPKTCDDPIQQAITGTSLDGTTLVVAACATLQSVNSDGEAVMRVVGTVTNTVTGETSTFNQRVAAPLQVTGTCEILNLTIGPIFLDLLGLVVETDVIHLEIRAEQGPGNLLGNLLCAVAGLLDPGQPLVDQVIGLLNQIIGLLSNL
jgi:hypothetical protein